MNQMTFSDMEYSGRKRVIAPPIKLEFQAAYRVNGAWKNEAITDGAAAR